jgi:hypothetical protein
MARRHDDRPIKRRGPTRQPRYRILVVCEGKKTEPGYFKQFQHHIRNPRLHIEPVGPAGVPITVVDTAIAERARAEHEARQQRDDNLRWDEVWAVFDIDDHPEVELAKQRASEHGVLLAISNPCFELWAYLHFAEQRAHIERGRLRSELQRHLPGYDKALEFAKIHAGYDDAVRRARALDDDATGAGRVGRNPTTGVYRLTETIRTR